MAGIPTNFQAISNVLPTYNFVDIIAGTGYVNFYAGKTVDLKLLSNFTFYADSISTASAVSADDDFDALLNRPLTIGGLGIVNVPIYASGANTSHVVVKLRKWDGVTETEIVNNSSQSYVSAGATYYMAGIDLSIPLTHFKIGEYLRLTIMTYKDAGLGDCYYAHDPKGRTTGWDASGAVPSTLIFQAPVRLSL